MSAGRSWSPLQALPHPIRAFQRGSGGRKAARHSLRPMSVRLSRRCVAGSRLNRGADRTGGAAVLSLRLRPRKAAVRRQKHGTAAPAVWYQVMVERPAAVARPALANGRDAPRPRGTPARWCGHERPGIRSRNTGDGSATGSEFRRLKRGDEEIVAIILS